jgi:tetratricopeptide (TPR) repeat protein
MKSFDFNAWEFWYLKGNKHLASRDWESAIDSFNQALRIAPETICCLHNLACVYE